MGALVAVLSASKRPVTKEDGWQVADRLKNAVANWQAVDSPVQAVQDATSLVRRSRLLMKQAGWTYNSTVLEDIQRILLGDEFGRRFPSWETHGSILAEWIRTQRSLEKPEDVIIRELENEAEAMTPTASIFLGSDLSTTGQTSASAGPAAAQSRIKDLEAKSAFAKKSSRGSAPVSSGTKLALTPARAAAVAKLGPAPVPGRDGVTLQGSDVCRFCTAPGHRVDQCPTVEYVAGRSGRLDDKWCRCFACNSFGHKQQDCSSSVQKNGVPSTATAPVGGTSV